MSETTVIADVADRLFDAIENSDVALVEQLWSADVTVWKTGDDQPRNRARSLRVIAWFINTTEQRRYQILDRQYFDGGFVQQHVLHAVAHTGGSIAMRVCIVVKLDVSGLISQIDEYFDPAELAPLLGADPS